YPILKDFINLIENQLNKKVKAIRCDNDTEFKNAHMIDLYGSKGIKREYKAVRTACYVLNRVLVTSPHNKTPYALLTRNIPSVSHLKPFGCHVTILNTSDHLGKFDGKADEGYIVGYSASKQHKAFYKAINVVSSISEPLQLLHMDLFGLTSIRIIDHKYYYLVITDDYSRFCWVLFLEHKDETYPILKDFINLIENQLNKKVSESFQGESSSSSLNDDVQQSPEEVIIPQTNSQSISNNMIPNVDEASTSHHVFNERLKDAYFDAITSFHDPSNIHTFYQPYPHEKKWTKDHPLHKIIAEALRYADWVSAMQEELDQFARLKVWRLVSRPEGKTVIKTKWIFKNQKDESSLVI
nr:hypothetical protein [Tanacetum cinerariifolium]